jgi:hypothetical protein
MLIKAQAIIFPKILLLDKKLNKKLVNNKIVFIIAYEEDDYIMAVYIKKLLLQRYKNFLSFHRFETKIMEFSEISEDTEATAIYALNSKTSINTLSKTCATKGIITFAYDINNLKNGLMFSLALEKDTVLYLNKENLNKHTTDFVDSLYEIVKFSNLN